MKYCSLCGYVDNLIGLLYKYCIISFKYIKWIEKMYELLIFVFYDEKYGCFGNF